MNGTAAICVVYKNEEMTCRYVNEELSKCKEVDHVVIVNNAATEESNEKLLSGIKDSELSDGTSYKSSRVIILPCRDNQGYAKGNNQGARFVMKFLHSKYLLITNDDIIIPDSEVVKKLITKLDSDGRIGGIGPKVVGKDSIQQGPECRISMFLYLLLPEILPISYQVFLKWILYKRYPLQVKEGFCYSVAGCFFMIRTEDFYKCGMMDEGTFLYFEENILAERLKGINKQNYWLPSANVVHLVGQSTVNEKTINKKKVLISCFSRSAFIYYYKYRHYPLKLTRFVVWLYSNLRVFRARADLLLKIKR